MGVTSWTGEAWGAIIAGSAALLAAVGGGCKYLLSRDRSFQAHERGWQRVAELDEEVRLLRIALHKATARGNAGWTVSEILSLAMPLPLEDRIRAVRQARQIAERSVGSQPGAEP
jgi:hypothetical protein